MADFIPTLSNARLQVRLERAISGKGPFRAFKDVLIDHPEERERWFQFKEQCENERVLDWLASEDIEPAD